MKKQDVIDLFEKLQSFASAIGCNWCDFDCDAERIRFRWEETWAYGGHEWCSDSIPVEWVELSVAEMVAKHKEREEAAKKSEADKVEAARIEKERIDAEAAEKRDRSNYERLKAKYEKGTDQP